MILLTVYTLYTTPIYRKHIIHTGILSFVIETIKRSKYMLTISRITDYHHIWHQFSRYLTLNMQITHVCYNSHTCENCAIKDIKSEYILGCGYHSYLIIPTSFIKSDYTHNMCRLSMSAAVSLYLLKIDSNVANIAL